MTAREMESRSASKNVSNFLRTVMCLTRELFQVKRRMKVDMRITSTKIRISVIISAALRVLKSSLIIYYS